MKRSQLIKVSLGGGKFRGKVVLSAEPTETGTLEDRLYRLDLLTSIANDPSLQVVAGHDFESLKMARLGGQWVVELEADL